MAGQALDVVGSAIARRFAVRIVAGSAGHSAVVRQVARTLEHPVGLEPNIVQAALVGQLGDFIEALVALTAKFLIQINRLELARVEDPGIVEVTRLDRGDVIFARAVTALAGDAWRYVAQFKMILTRCRGGMATETLVNGLGSHRSAERGIK